jgi:hypothetical protein
VREDIRDKKNYHQFLEILECERTLFVLSSSIYCKPMKRKFRIGRDMIKVWSAGEL